MRSLRDGWQWRQSPLGGTTRLRAHQVAQLSSSPEGFISCSRSLPTDVHLELLASGRISHPFLADNEDKVQWVGEESWLFRLEFDFVAKKETTELVFDKLDTFATVWLDGEVVHENDNGFLCDQRANAAALLSKKKRHVLLIQFESAYLHGKDLAAKSDFKVKAWNGDPSRCYVRKPQYHWGWDWGPTLMAFELGSVWLHTYSCKIVDFFPRTNLDEQLNATIVIDCKFEGDCAEIKDVFVRFTEPNGKSIDLSASLHGDGSLHIEHRVQSPMLWWPSGLGSQSLHTVELIVLDRNGKILVSQKKRIGLRRIRLVEEPVKNEPGTSFLFEVNNVPIFTGGSNWIPGDSFLSRLTPERCREWLMLARDGHQNMIRAWGGGIYESDAFYDTCDELGLLVWQDFPFACGLYPADDAFCANVKREAEVNVKRIRHHASLALLAGNNEDYQVAEAYGLYDPKSKDYATTFPARKIYEDILPEVVDRLTDAQVIYRPGCPWTGANTRDPYRGDAHQWSVWHGSQERYQDWDRLLNRFTSEWGMQAYPGLRTIDYWLDGRREERFPQSRLIAQHQKADGGERRLAVYLEENFRHRNDLESYVYTTQLMQADCARMAVQTWRRQFRGPGAYGCAGSLIWQLNDCWPVISWSIVDSFRRPKAAYYTMKRALAPLALGSRRSTKRVYEDDRTATHYKDSTTISVWLSNISREAARGLKACIEVVDLRTSETISASRQSFDMDAMSCFELEPVYVEGEGAKRTAEGCVVGIRVLDSQNRIGARLIDWPEPFKYLTLPSAAKVKLDVRQDENSKTISIVSKAFVKGLIFSLTTDDAMLDDNALDLMPKDVQIIRYTGKLKREELSWRYLHDDE